MKRAWVLQIINTETRRNESRSMRYEEVANLWNSSSPSLSLTFSLTPRRTRRFVVPESPRWLLVKGRIDEVRRIIESAASFNGRQLPVDYQLTPPTQESSSQDFTYLFRSGYLRRISICFFCIWFTMNLVYYGIILNMSSFGGNVYLNSVSWQFT